MIEGTARLDKELAFNSSLKFTTTPVQIDVVDYDYGDRYKDELKGCLVRITDQAGKVVCDWRSAEVAIKEKTWENTNPAGAGGSNPVIVR